MRQSFANHCLILSVTERYPWLTEEGISRARYDLYFRVRCEYISLVWDDPSRADDSCQAMRFYYADWPYFNDPMKNRKMLGEVRLIY